MMQIGYNILVFATLGLMISCVNNKNDSKSINSEYAEKQSVDSVNKTTRPETKKKKTEDRHPKVLTYTEIVEKNEELLKYYEESKQYSSDTIVKRNRMNNSFYSYLTTQLRYMLSSELRLLRNEFFARKGYKFKSDDLNEYFSEYYWYNGEIDDAKKIVLTPLEKEIIDTIKVYEKKNGTLNSRMLKERLADYCKENVKNEYGYIIIEIPTILFRRNIGYLVEGMPMHNKYWFNGENIRIQVIDTLENNSLLLGLFGQVMCPDQFCLYGGELITCDSNLCYLDSESIEYETIESTEDDKGKLYRFEAPNSTSSTLTLVRINNDGQIEIE